MTLLVSWVGKDSRKISSFYIASDSRLSWDNTVNYDYGRKVFAFKNSPDIVGYCGDVLYPTLVLGQILEMDNDNLLFNPNHTNQERSRILFDEIQEKFSEYPSKQDISIIHVSRQNETDFLCNVFCWTKNDGWNMGEKEIPDSSDEVIILGTGKKEFDRRYRDYLKGYSGKTSRALFQCLSHSLLEISDLKMNDLRCGGAPQLVGLYNKFNGKNLGVIYEGKRYFLGREIEPNNRLLNNIEWRNGFFERCDGVTTEILNSAQRQPDELSYTKKQVPCHPLI
jgi:hypothetical protein